MHVAGKFKIDSGFKHSIALHLHYSQASCTQMHRARVLTFHCNTSCQLQIHFDCVSVPSHASCTPRCPEIPAWHCCWPPERLCGCRLYAAPLPAMATTSYFGCALCNAVFVQAEISRLSVISSNDSFRILHQIRRSCNGSLWLNPLLSTRCLDAVRILEMQLASALALL